MVTIAIELAAVYVPITPSLKGAAAQIQKELGGVDVSGVGQSVGASFGQRIMGAVGTAVKVGAVAVGATIATGVGTALVKGFQRLNAIDVARAKLTGLGNDAGTVSVVMENALASVRGTAFGLGDAATVAAQLVAAQIKPGEDLQGVLKSVANSAAAAGTGLDEMGSIYAKVASLGKAQNDVLQQVADRGIPIYQSLADQFGVTTEEIFKMASEGKIGFSDFQQAMTSAAGTVADELGNTVGGSWANFIASLGRIGAGLLGGVFPKIAPSIQAITASMAPLEALAGTIGARVGSVLAPAMERLVGVITGDIKLGWVTELAGGFRAMVQAFKDGGNDLTSAGVAGVMESIGLAARSIVDSGILAFASPFSIIFAALQQSLPTVAGSLAAVASQITQALGQALPYVVEVLGAFADILATVIPALLPAVSDLVLLLGSGLAGALNFIGPALGPIVVGILAGVAAFKAWTGAIRLWTTITVIASTIQAAFNAVLAANPIMLIVIAIAAIVGALIYFFTQTELGQQIWANFMSFLTDAWNNIVNVATTVWNALAGFFATVWTAISQTVTDAWNGIVAFLTPIFNFIGGLIQFHVDVWKNIFLVVAAVFVTIWNWITEVFTGAWNAIIGFITPIVTALVGFFVSYFTDLFSFWSGVWGAISDFFTGIWNKIVAFVAPIVMSVVMAVQGPLQALQAWWNGIWNAISSFFSNIWNGIVNSVSTAVGRVGEVIGGIYDIVMNAIGDAGSWLVSAGSDIVRGIWDGIAGMGDWLFKKVTGFFGGIVDWAKGVLDIQSPSRVFRYEVGQMVGAGMALGITDSESAVQNAMDSLLAVPPAPGSLEAFGAGEGGSPVGSADGARTFNLFDRDGVLLGSMQGVVAAERHAENVRLGGGKVSL